TGLKAPDGATTASISAVNLDATPKFITISGTLSSKPAVTTVFTASKQSVGLVDVDIDLTALGQINLLNKGSLTLVNGIHIGADPDFPTGPGNGIVISPSAGTVGFSGTINLFASSQRGAQLGSAMFATRVESGTSTPATLTINATSYTTADGTLYSQAYLEVGSGIAINKKSGGGFLRVSLPSDPAKSSFNSSITLSEGAILLANGVSGTNLSTSGTSPMWIGFEGAHTFNYVNVASGSLGLATTTPDGSAVGSISPYDPHVLSIDTPQDSVSEIKAFIKNNIFDDSYADSVQFSIAKKGLGSLTLDNVNTFLGDLILEQGTLNLTQKSNSLDTVDSSDNPIRVLTSSPFGLGNLVLSGTSATIRLTPTVSPFQEEPVTIELGNNINLFSSKDAGDVARKITFSSGSLPLNGMVHNLTLSGTIDATPFASLDTFMTSGTVILEVLSPVAFTGKLTGGIYPVEGVPGIPVILEKRGASVLTLASASKYYGDLRIAEGTLVLGNILALGDADDFSTMNSVTVQSGGVFDLGGISPRIRTTDPSVDFPDGVPL
ncbi:MAG: autotransporter-associated beta strand repeat-containing protein, partial [Pseudomonadota bacterium]